MPADTVYVGRPTVWGNPFVVGSELIGGGKLSAAKSIALYRQYAQEAFNPRDLRAYLRGKISPAGVRSASPVTPMFCSRWRTQPEAGRGREQGLPNEAGFRKTSPL